MSSTQLFEGRSFFTLLPDTEAGPQLAVVVEFKHEELS